MEGALTGLCARCAHARRITSAKGSLFVLCGRSATDARFPKYPPLPVVRCAGYEPAPPPRIGGPEVDQGAQR